MRVCVCACVRVCVCACVRVCVYETAGNVMARLSAKVVCWTKHSSRIRATLNVLTHFAPYLKFLDTPVFVQADTRLGKKVCKVSVREMRSVSHTMLGFN